MKQFKARALGGKVRVRGMFRIKLFTYSLGMAINFGRIPNYLTTAEINGPTLVESASICALKWLKSAFFGYSYRINRGKDQILTLLLSLVALHPFRPLYAPLKS